MRHFLKDESGIAMGLAVIVVVIVGVMGAGLLVFVRNDLQAVVEVNQGQQAFEAADAGAQAARRELLSNACPQSYDGSTEEDDECDESEWSHWSEGEGKDYEGKELDFDGKKIKVEISYLERASSEAETLEEGHAPEITGENEDEREFFKIESLGMSENGDARRKIEAIYHTEDLGVPEAYYSPNNVDISGTADIDSVSIFSRGDVSINGNARLTGEDISYGNWQNEYNDEPRATEEAGIGALGSISGGGSERGTRDFDANTGTPFVENAGDREMTFPFDADSQSDEADERRIDFLRQEAKSNGIHHLSSGGKVDVGSDFEWPENADNRTVVFVEYTDVSGNNQVDWEVGNASDPSVKGTLVVYGGDFRTTQNKACLRGIVIVRGGEYEEGDSTDTGGNTCLEGFVNASGDIKLAGNVQPFSSEEVANRPGFYGVELWSWRELYE